MSLADDLLEIAEGLLPKAGDIGAPRQANLRRAISTAYYALFHTLMDDFSLRMIGAASKDDTDRRRLRRALSHSRIRDRCQALVRKSPTPARAAFGKNGPRRFLEEVALAFIDLQDARHRADYDLLDRVSLEDARAVIARARTAIQAWAGAASLDDRNAKERFALLLLMDDAQLRNTWRI